MPQQPKRRLGQNPGCDRSGSTPRERSARGIRSAPTLGTARHLPAEDDSTVHTTRHATPPSSGAETDRFGRKKPENAPLELAIAPLGGGWGQMRLILASASPARLATLRSAGIEPDVIVSGVDESAIAETDAAALALTLARLKCRAVATAHTDALVVGCDSVLAFDGEIFGKPRDAAEATARWRRMRGNSGVLHTGHCVRLGDREVVRGAATTVYFAAVNDVEIDAYVATGEPLHVAGAFTIDGLGGAFISGIEGDPHNVVGLSLPLLRTMVSELDIEWMSLWAATA